ncbi:MAG: hypothetical protein IT447_16960 [Phycisphaerales bacterium]|nr:hypothetical protein [Phycisphaerales bacterium]
MDEQLSQNGVELPALSSLIGEVVFEPDFGLNISNLEAKVQPKREDFREVMLASLERNMREGETLQNFWNWLYSEGCTAVKVESGLVNFYKNTDRIDISAHTAAIEMRVTPDILRELIAKRKEVIGQTRLALAALKAEIEAGRNQNNNPSSEIA